MRNSLTATAATIGFCLLLLMQGLAFAQDSTPAAKPGATPPASPVTSPVASPAAASPVASPVPVTPRPYPDLPPAGTPVAAHLAEGLFPGMGAIQLVKVADGLQSPRVLTSANDGSGRLFVGERFGVIRIITREGALLPEPFLDIGYQIVSVHQDQGLLGIAFAPDYETSGYFYVAYTDYNVNGSLAIAQYQVSADDPNKANPNSGMDVIKLAHPTPILNGGTLHFGPDGYLYIASGNGAFFGVHDIFTAQTLDNHLGKILRIQITNVDGAAGFSTPPDNPFNMTYEYWDAQHVWAFGLRNPWQFSFDPLTGDMYIPDVGEAGWEEISFIPAGSKGGQNFGWPAWEGMHCVNFATTGSCPEIGIPPVAEYAHGEDGCAVIGFGVYRGRSAAFLDGVYLSGDYCTGRIRGLSRDPAGNWQFQDLLDTSMLLPGGGLGEDGEVYVLSCECDFGPGKVENNPGAVWRIVATGNVPPGSEIAPTE